METSNSNLVGQLENQNKRSRSPDRKPEEPKLLTHSLDLHDDLHNILHKEYRSGWRQVNVNPDLWWPQESTKSQELEARRVNIVTRANTQST